MTDYCDVQFSWTSDKSIDLITEYSVTNEETDLSLSNELELSRTNNEDCQFEISCKSLYKVAVEQFEIVTEARVVELYDYTEGYLLSQRGVPVSSQSSDQELYKITCTLSTPIRKFYGKFKSMPNKDRVKVYKIKINVTTCDDISLSENTGDTINVPKLKQLVAELGDEVPDNAKSLLEAMEQYQKNKVSTVDDIKQQLCQESIGQDTSMSGLSKMVAMFSQLNASTSSNQSPAASQNALFSMISSVQNGQQTDNEGMYQFLKTICGQVTDMRAPIPSPTDTEELNKNEMRKSEILASGAASSTEANTKVDEKLQELEIQVLTKVDKKIDALEQRLTSKLDLILQGLNIQPKQEMDLD
ncbi:hypothetical protein LOTGIDRAFT_164294 [Lottia gigantea]|uniref:Uncharacterized protein n=1 Tax=Lottia gigantea TaxID=225164 RepID=V3ZGN8_LOTGI|nr:hypothetical protein LOTGIDRAFT_164294 [Lottia gigantea]ESO90368.1 hypothetical protein LOTGIDRAFT_164294 [Lottia gigantea]